MMDNEKEKNVLSYDHFLSGLNYDETQVEQYFNNIISSLEKELFSLRDSEDKKLIELYEQFDEKRDKFSNVHNELKISYENEYNSILSKYNQDILALANTCQARINEIRDKIQLEDDQISVIKFDFLKEFHEAIRVPNKKIRDINNKIDVEYTAHADAIFAMKAALIKNTNEYYLSASSHLNEIEKLTRFFNELLDYSTKLRTNIKPVSFKENDNRISLYLEYIKENKDNWAKLDSFFDKYGVVNSAFDEVIKELDKKYNEKVKECLVLKKNYKEKIDLIRQAIDKTNAKFDEIEANLTNKKDLKLAKDERNAIIEKLNNDIVSLSFITNIESDLLNSEKQQIENFKNKINEINDEITKSYGETIKKNQENLIDSINMIETVLIDTQNGLSKVNDSFKETQSLLVYFEGRYRKIAFQARVDALNQYKEYIEKSVENNKKLDAIAFELITSDEVKTLKLLDLEKEYLTVDEYLKIKETKYEIERKEIEALLPHNLNIANYNSEIDLLMKDLFVDKDIKKHELDNELKMFNIRRDADFMRLNYMLAYERIDNVRKIIKIKGESENLIEEINNQIKIQKLTEIALLEGVSRKKEYDSLVEKYDKAMEKLDIDTKSRIRYQNDILEIERDNFEATKARTKEIYDDLRQTVYPEIIDIKDDYYKKISYYKKKLNGSKKNEVKENREKINLHKKARLEFNKLYDETLRRIDEIDAHDSDVESKYFLMVNSFQYEKAIELIFENYSNGVNNILSKYYNENPIDAKSIKNSYFVAQYKKATKQKERNKVIKTHLAKYKAEINRIKKEFIKVINSKLPESKEEEQKYLAEYEEMLNKLIIDETIDNNKKLSPYLDDLAEIDVMRDKVSEDTEKSLQEYKDHYLETIRNIEEEYNQKIAGLTDLKNAVLEKSNTKNADIDQMIYDFTQELIEKKEQNIITNDSVKNKNKKDSDDKVKSLQSEVSSINKSVDNNKNQIEQDNTSFRNEMAIKAKEDFNEFQLSELNNKKKLDKELIDHDNAKEEYIRKITVESLSTKEKYADTRKEIETSSEKKKADNLIEYQELFDYNKKHSIGAIENVSDPISKFGNDIEKITHELLIESEKLSNQITSSSKEEYEMIINNTKESGE